MRCVLLADRTLTLSTMLCPSVCKTVTHVLWLNDAYAEKISEKKTK